MRLNRYIAQCGVCSRRHADELILEGQVTVNGFPARELGTVIDPEEDQVVVQGKRVKPPAGRVYILLYKPRGVITTLDDPHGRPTVAGLIDLPRRVVPVGRLDQDSSGVLLLTDDGDLCHRLLHPSSRLAKEYLVLLDRPLTATELERFRTGILLEGERTQPAEIEAVGRSLKHARYRVVLREGRNRQIRRMVEALGAHVERLSRKSFAGLGHEGMEPGEWRFLGRKEVDQLRKAVKATSGHEVPYRPEVTPAGDARPTAPRRNTTGTAVSTGGRKPSSGKPTRSPDRPTTAAKPSSRPAAGKGDSRDATPEARPRGAKPAGRAQARVTSAPPTELRKPSSKTSSKTSSRTAPTTSSKSSSRTSPAGASAGSTARPAPKTSAGSGTRPTRSGVSDHPSRAGAPERKGSRTGAPGRQAPPSGVTQPTRGADPRPPARETHGDGAPSGGRTSPWAKTRLAQDSRKSRDTESAGKSTPGKGSARTEGTDTARPRSAAGKAGRGGSPSTGAPVKSAAAKGRPAKPAAKGQGRAISRGESGSERGESAGTRDKAPSGSKAGWASRFIPAPKKATPKGSVRGPASSESRSAGSDTGRPRPATGKPAAGGGASGRSASRSGQPGKAPGQGGTKPGGAKGRDTGSRGGTRGGKPGRG